MAGIYWLLLIPLLAPVAVWIFSYYRTGETLSPLAVIVAAVIGCVVLFGSWQLGRYSQMADTEIWNGQVTGKKQVRVSCSHSYECFCTTDSKGNRTCQTCYEHSVDYDWMVYTSAGNLYIPRVDRQGTRTPPRWAAVRVGEPASIEHSYNNYVQAVPQSIYNLTAANDETLPAAPQYPRVYDYYRLNRVLMVGANYAGGADLNQRLNASLRALGPQKQANVIVVVVNTPDQMYRYKLEAAWVGGNKNDVIVLLGTNAKADTLLWVDVITFAKNTGNEMFQVQLRDTILNGKSMDSAKIANAISTNITKLYDRPQMADFEYLKKAIHPPTYVVVIGLILGLVFGFIGMAVVTSQENKRFIARNPYGGYRWRR